MSSRFHRVTSTVRWRRSAVGVLAGLAAAAAAVTVPSALATGKSPPAGKSKPAPAGSTMSSNNTCPGTVPPAIASAIAQLEHAGTINSTQAQAIDALLSQECSVDLKPLVNNATITAAQEGAVLNALAHAKMSLARAQDAHRRDAPARKTRPAGKTSPGDTSCRGAPDPVFPAAVARLEQTGTIDSTQVQAIDAQMQGCTFDLQQLVHGGTITAAQAQAVQNALAHAKMSLASR